MAKRKLTKAELIAENAEEQYFLNGSKMIPYPVDVYGRIIEVPDDEKEKAEGSLMIQHFINKGGFKIEYVAPGLITKKKIFNPKTTERKVLETVKVEEFCKLGDKFKIFNPEIICLVVEVRGETAFLDHLGTFSKRVPTKIATIIEMCKREAWEKL